MIKYFQQLNWLKLAKILRILVIFYIIVLSSLCLFKFFTFKYNGLDLAIFNQVFYNTAQGDWFNFSIFPTSYLADHFTPIILLFLPLYYLWQSPITLLLLQTLFLGLATIPLYFLVKKHLTPLQGLAVILIYLFNPLTLNINLYEFHLLSLLPFFIFWTFYFYDKNNFKLFLLLAGLSLLIKEDVSFIIFMFGIVAILDKKSLKWILTPLLASIVYFFTAISIISYFSPVSSFKFIVYYNYLGQSIQEIAVNFFLKFHLVLLHFFSISNLALILGFALMFLFIPFFRPKYLLLCLGFFLQLSLSIYGGYQALTMHYGSSLLVAGTISFIFSLKYIRTRAKYRKIYNDYQELVIIIFIVVLIYNLFSMGPLGGAFQHIWQTDYQEVKLKHEFIKHIPNQASIVTTYDLLPSLSSRKKLYSLNYAFLGWQQFNAGPYIIPDDTEYLLVNFDDFIIYYLQYEKNDKDYYLGDDRLRQIINQQNFQLKKAEKNLALWQKNIEPANFNLVQVQQTVPEIQNPLNQNINQSIEFIGSDKNEQLTSLYFKSLKPIEKNYFIKLNGQIFPTGYGFYPTSNWQPNEIIQLNLINWPEITNLKIIEIQGDIEFDKFLYGKKVIDSETTIAEINL